MNFPVGSNRYFVVPPQAQSTAGSANPPDNGEPKDATASPAQPTPSSSFVVPPEAQSSSPGGGASSDSVPPPGAPPVLTQHGGAVLTAPKVANLYLGNYWSSAAGQQDIQKNDTFSNEFGQSAMMGLAKEYGAGATQFLGSTVVGSSNTSRVTEADVQSTVKQAISSGAVKKDAQGLYNVVLPPDAVLDAGGGVTSKQGLGGFHGSFDDGTGKPVYYSVIAYSDAKGNGINFDGSSQDAVGITESHEWMEAMTDPDVNSPIAGRGLAWYDDKDNGEIGDLAIRQLPLSQTFSKDAAGFQQQLEWSNKDGLYELASKGSPPPPPPGDVTGTVAANAAFGSGKPATSSLTLDKDIKLNTLTVAVAGNHKSGKGLKVVLTSPQGTSVQLPIKQGRQLQQVLDVSKAFSGESTKGTWTLTMSDSSSKDSGTLTTWSLDAKAP